MDVEGSGKGPVAFAGLGVLIGAAVVALAAALGTRADGWRTDAYFAATAASGFYPGCLTRERRTVAAGGLAAGQFLAAIASVWPAVRLGEGFALYWPMFVVPTGLAVMAIVAVAVAGLRSRRGG